MPLPADERIVEIGKEILQDFYTIAGGKKPGYRPGHAKGLLLKGAFTPTPDAGKLSKAPHFNNSSTPVIARFSNSTGFPQLPDSDDSANPRGLAVRFVLAEEPRRLHTDIIAHSTPAFPVRDGAEAREIFHAIATGKAPEFLGTHPAALRFVTMPKPFQASFARENYYAISAFKLVSSGGSETFIRYRFVPPEGVSYLTDEEAKAKGPNYLFDELPTLVSGGRTIVLKLVAQIAAEGDVTDDATVQWPDEGRDLVELGIVTLDGLVEDDVAQQRRIIFDPIPRVEGVEPSADPLFDVRAGLYLMSGLERRAGGAEQSTA